MQRRWLLGSWCSDWSMKSGRDGIQKRKWGLGGYGFEPKVIGWGDFYRRNGQHATSMGVGVAVQRLEHEIGPRWDAKAKMGPGGGMDLSQK